jgi:hypothetical protein
MAAIVVLNEWNGSVLSPTKTIKAKYESGVVYNDTILPKVADDPTVNSLNPIPIPKSGISLSFEKWLKFRIGAIGPAGSITNLKFFTGGSNLFGTGILLLAGVTATYVQPTIATSSVATVDAITYVAGSPLSLGTGPFTGTNVDIGSFCVLQAVISPLAAEGLSGTIVPTFSYDET